MKRTLVGIVLAGLYATASAQGYAGAIVGISNYDLDCKGFTPCDKKGTPVKLYAGSRSKDPLISAGSFKLDTVEVSYIRFGTAKARVGTRSDTYRDTSNPAQPVDVTVLQPVTINAKADALTMAGVGRFTIAQRFDATAKLGLAYVNSTVKTATGSTSTDSETTSKVQPYAGLGVEYTVLDKLRLVGAFDFTRFDSDGQKGTLYLFGVGAQYDF
ncbi:MAG TPA: outer membrane beta-barrel protein [Candidatus Aquabacterium excrementipullorum]|nr:outer membrane beta-barrel protein [Candidatus Aquabacterium excrementipullorum]